MSSVLKSVVLICCLWAGLVPLLLAEGQPDPAPRLRLEPGIHFAPIKRIDVDAAERFVVTASVDKTARVWDLRTGELLQVLRPPIGDNFEGRLFAVAISPDGEQVAVAGWTGYEWDSEHSIYIFQRSNGQLLTRLRKLPNAILHLTFSADGHKLAATLAKGGIRLFDTNNWQELARDSDYGADSYSIDFSADGRMVSTSYNGYIRLYDAKLKLLHKQQTKGGQRPFFARFAPNGKQIAVGFDDSTRVDILSGQDLQWLRSQETQGIEDTLNSIAWSQDGQRLYAGGRYDDGEGKPLVVWDKAGTGKRSLWQSSQNTIMDIKPLKDGGVVVGTADPTLLRLDARGQVVWKQTSGVLSFTSRTSMKKFGANEHGQVITIYYEIENRENNSILTNQITWDLKELNISKGDCKSTCITPRYTDGLDVTNWDSEYNPKLNNTPIPLKKYERSRSLAIAPDNQSFALGTEWHVRLYKKDGTLRWQKPVPVAWAVNISGDNRWVVAAQADGTIRWYEKESGEERLAFYLHPDEKRWVAWTPEGFYAAAEGAEELIGYHLNQGANQAAQFIRINQIGSVFNRGDIVSKALEDDYPQLAQAALKEAGDIREILQAGLPPKIEISGGTEQSLKQREFELNLTLFDQGGGIGKVEYRINGDVVSSGAARPLAARAPAGQKGYKRAFTLPNGENRIEVIPYSANNKVAADAITVLVNVDDPQHREPSLHVLSIGVSDYRDPAFDLNYAADDAIDFAATLQKQGRKLFKAVETEVLVDNQVSLQRIERAFNDMAQQVQPQDVFVLYLAGHGLVVDGRYHYVPHDVIYENDKAIRANALGEEKLKEWLALIEVGKRMMVIDSCHAGKALPALAALDAPQSRGVEDKAAISRLMKATGSSVLAAASGKQQAMEGIIENGQGRGLFTHVLLKGLQGDADIIDQDGMIDVGELQSYARKQVPKLSNEKWKYEQFPMFHLNGQDFPITQVR